MYLILFVLSDYTCMDDILASWEEAGVRGITILPSTGLARLRNAGLRDDMPLFPSLEDLFQDQENLNRTLFTVIESDSMVDKIVAATERVIGPLTNPNTGILIVLPVARAYGLKKNY